MQAASAAAAAATTLLDLSCRLLPVQVSNKQDFTLFFLSLPTSSKTNIQNPATMQQPVVVGAVLRFGSSDSVRVCVFLAASDATAFQFGIQAEGHEFQGIELADDRPGDALTAMDPIIPSILLFSLSCLALPPAKPSFLSSLTSLSRFVEEAQHAPLLDNVDTGSGGPRV